MRAKAALRCVFDASVACPTDDVVSDGLGGGPPKGELLETIEPMTSRPCRPWLAAACVAALIAPAVAAHAESLADALAIAYQSNPTLQSQRALQRQLDETYVQARAALRPTASAAASSGYSETPAVTGAITRRDAAGVTLSVSQPVYTGGRAATAIDAAEATVLAGRQNLRTIEQTVLQSVIQAYQDVLRDQQIVEIRQLSVSTLSSQLDETRARMDVGLLTRTDVAKAEAQLAASRATLSSAQAQLQISRANYTTAVGQNPGQLAQPAALPGLPADIDHAFDVAEGENPALRRAQITEQASRFRVAQVRAQRNPTFSVQGSYGYAGAGYGSTGAGFQTFEHSLSVTGVITQPLFTGGSVSSQIRAALEQNTSDRVLIEQARRAAVQSVSQAWNQMQAALANITSNQEQVSAATIAFQGTQEQYAVGISTTLDVLLAQETLRSAQVSLIQAQHDAYVAQAGLLNAMGRLDAPSLLSGVSLYDPDRNFEQVRDANAVPWEPVVEVLDQIGRPAGGDPNRPVPGPAPASGPVGLNAPSGATPAPGFSVTVPTNPATGQPAPSGAAAPQPRVLDSPGA